MLKSKFFGVVFCHFAALQHCNPFFKMCIASYTLTGPILLSTAVHAVRPWETGPAAPPPPKAGLPRPGLAAPVLGLDSTCTVERATIKEKDREYTQQLGGKFVLSQYSHVCKECTLICPISRRNNNVACYLNVTCHKKTYFFQTSSNVGFQNVATKKSCFPPSHGSISATFQRVETGWLPPPSISHRAAKAKSRANDVIRPWNTYRSVAAAVVHAAAAAGLST